MTIRDRLLQILEYKGLSSRSFALKIGVSSQRFGKYLKDRDPDYETLNKIIETFVDIDPGWLLSGRGDMLKNINVISGDKNMTVSGNSNVAIGRDNNGNISLSDCRDQLKDALTEITRLEERIKHLEERLQDKEEMVEILKMREKRNNGAI